MKISSLHILVYTLVATIALYVVESIIAPTYGIQLIQKVILFLLIPVGLGYFSGVRVGVFGKWTRDSWILGIGLGLLSMIVIWTTYIILEGQIDWSAIRSSMEARHITEATFVLIFLYIMLGNSLLEEYFFRGVIFRHMLTYSTPFAYIASSLMFALYHMTIFRTWFSGYILALALLGLFLGGLFFAWLYRRTGGVWGAWVFHIFADLAILAIGYYQFFY